MEDIRIGYRDKKTKKYRCYFEDQLDADFKKAGITTKEQLAKIYRKEFKEINNG